MFTHRDEACAGFWTQKARLGTLYWACPDCGATAPNSDAPSVTERVFDATERVLNAMRRNAKRVTQGELPA